MLPTCITIMVIIAGLTLWVISVQRQLVVLDDNIENAMHQIGVQLACRFDALIALLELSQAYEGQEGEDLLEAIKLGRVDITAQSTPNELLQQEEIINAALSRIAMIGAQEPELGVKENYIKNMDTAESFANMLRTSYLIYNDSVSKLNHKVSSFPIIMIAGLLGFLPKKYL